MDVLAAGVPDGVLKGAGDDLFGGVVASPALSCAEELDLWRDVPLIVQCGVLEEALRFQP